MTRFVIISRIWIGRSATCHPGASRAGRLSAWQSPSGLQGNPGGSQRNPSSRTWMGCRAIRHPEPGRAAGQSKRVAAQSATQDLDGLQGNQQSRTRTGCSREGEACRCQVRDLPRENRACRSAIHHPEPGWAAGQSRRAAARSALTKPAGKCQGATCCPATRRSNGG
jgi:hypothetical protein